MIDYWMKSQNFNILTDDKNNHNYFKINQIISDKN